MKKLSFIMAVIMIVMTFPMMFMSSASAEVVAVDADAPDMLPTTVTDPEAEGYAAGISADYPLYQYASDAEAVADGAIGRFTKAGGNGYAKAWNAVGANAGDSKIGSYTHFFLIDNYHFSASSAGACIAVHTGGGRSVIIDGGLGALRNGGTGENFEIKNTHAYGRVFSVNQDNGATGTTTLKNLRITGEGGTGAIIQIINNCTYNLVIDNCVVNAPKAKNVIVARLASLIIKDSVFNCNNANNSAPLILKDNNPPLYLRMTNCKVTANTLINSVGSDNDYVFTNVTHVGGGAPDSKQGAYQSTSTAATSGNKVVFNNCSLEGTYGFVLRNNHEIELNNTNVTAVKEAIFHLDNKAATNVVININGGVYTGKGGRILWSSGTKGATYNFNDGTFVAYNLKDEPVAAGNGETVGDKGMFYLSNCKALNIYGGSYTLYKDHGVTLCEKSPIILGWATGGVNTNVYGGKFTGGSCFFAKVKNDSNAKFDEAGSVFYGYGEGKNYINIAPEVVKGASIRLDAKSGLRFTSTIAANTINYLNAALVKAETELTYGTVITRASYLKYTGGVFTMEAFDKAGKNYVNVVAKDGVAKNADGSVTINAALVDIDAANYDKDFVAISYVKYTNANDEEVYIYATNVSLAENARNMEEVALAALADVKTKAEGAYTNAVSEYYVYNVAARKYELYTGTAYSAYTAEQVKALQSYIVVEE